MTIYSNEIEALAGERVLVLGFFDGVHLGHQSLLRRMREAAAEKTLIPTVFTFLDPPGLRFRGKDKFRGLLQSREDRLRTLESLGARDIVAVPASQEIFDIEAEDFLKLFLDEKMQVKEVVVGMDFHFGRKAKGTPEMLQDYCDKQGKKLTVMPATCWKEDILSSTLIRNALEEGRTEEASGMMGRPFSHLDIVQHGKKLGRKLGFPTLNLRPDPNLVVPKMGVYATLVEFSGKKIPAVTNLGVRPTVSDEEILLSESYLYSDVAPDYGEEIRVSYLKFTRAEEKFPDLESMQKTVMQDLAEVKEYHQNAGFLEA